MEYYEIWVASQNYRGDKPLVYRSQTPLKRGNVVIVELQNRKVPGIIVKKTIKPSFVLKDIIQLVTDAPIPEKLLILLEWMKDYYPAPTSSLLQLLIPSSLSVGVKKIPPSTHKENITNISKSAKAPKLTQEQQSTLDSILNSSVGSILLHGDTGTGKTRVYEELAERSLNSGKSVIVLTPEIGLTTQLSNNLKRLGAETVILHSSITSSEKRNIWLRLMSTSGPVIIIGTRSALFAPVNNIGLIVMDEAHDGAYKQDKSPKYQTSRVAAKLASIHGAKLIMGTATPSVQDYYTFRNKQSLILTMNKPAIKTATPPKIIMIDSKDRKNFQRSSYLSDSLISSVENALRKNEQSLIYLNRRGTAKVILCNDCGWQAMCPNCDLALTYHGDSHCAKCHICGYKIIAPSYCKKCHNTEIIYKSAGTKAIVDELQRLYPEAKIMRFDTDTIKQDRIENQYQAISSGSIDILVGTQMLSKGLDLPKLSVVCLVQADTGLLIPDFSSNESTFQHISQIIGRVGRGHLPGRVVVQSHNHDNIALQAAVKHDYLLFYIQEIKEREVFMFPPFCFLLKLECSRSTPKNAKKAAESLSAKIKTLGMPIRILGPGPSFHEKSGNNYRWQIIIKAKQRKVLTRIIQHLPSNWSYDIDPDTLL